MSKKKFFIASGIIVAVLSFASIAIVQSQSQNVSGSVVDVVNPVIEPLKTEVMLPGTVKSEHRQSISFSPDLGETYQLLVEEGDDVNEGADLIQYDGTQSKSEQEKVALQIEAGYLHINYLEKQEEEVKKREKGLKKEVGEKEAKETVQAEKDQLEFERKNANLDLRQLLLLKEELEEQKQKLTIKSELAGTVLSAEENPIEQKPIIEIIAADQLIVEGTLSEYDSLVVEEDQTVAITSDAQPGEEWTGTVSSIGFMPIENELTGGDGERTEYPVTIKLDDGDITKLKPGYNLILRIATEEKQALTVPSSAVLSEEDTSYVLIIEEGKAIRREVTVGIQSGSNSEIVNGLTEEVDVVVNPSGVNEGNEVSIND